MIVLNYWALPAPQGCSKLKLLIQSKNYCWETLQWGHLLLYSFLPLIVSAHSPLALCTVTLGFPNSKKNSFHGNYMRKYGMYFENWFSLVPTKIGCDFMKCVLATNFKKFKKCPVKFVFRVLEFQAPALSQFKKYKTFLSRQFFLG